LVGGWVVGGMVDGAVDKIVQHVIWKLKVTSLRFPLAQDQKDKISVI